MLSAPGARWFLLFSNSARSCWQPFPKQLEAFDLSGPFVLHPFCWPCPAEPGSRNSPQPGLCCCKNHLASSRARRRPTSSWNQALGLCPAIRAIAEGTNIRSKACLDPFLLTHRPAERSAESEMRSRGLGGRQRYPALHQHVGFGRVSAFLCCLPARSTRRFAGKDLCCDPAGAWFVPPGVSQP